MPWTYIALWFNTRTGRRERAIANPAGRPGVGLFEPAGDSVQSHQLKAQPVASVLVGHWALYEDAALRSDPDTFDLAIVIGITNGFVRGRALVQPSPEVLALVEIEVQLGLRQRRLLGRRRFG